MQDPLPSQAQASSLHHPNQQQHKTQISGGRFDFEDGGTFCGGWEDSKAHGHGVCTGPKNQGAYSGAWHYGFEVSGVYTWPSGSSFEGQWQNGKRHGLGIETRGRWIYRGEWTQGFKGRYGVRQSATSTAKYEGTWANGLQDGYGSETYADSGTYQGQWLRGMRHGYGVRQSAPFGLASRFRPKSIRASLTSLRSNDGNNNQAPTPDPAEKRNHRVDDSRGGFVLKAKSDEPPPRRNSLVEKTKKGLLSGLKIRKQRSTGDLEKRTGSGSIRSTASTASWISTESSQSGITNKSVHTDSNASFIVEDEQLDGSVTETYMGEWKNDKRCGYGISERSDGLKYEGEWFANKKYGYGVTTFRDGTKEEGKYKNNVLITSQKKKHLFLIRSAKFRERIDAAVDSAQRASKYALQKADIAISRTATARGKAELADVSADHARVDSEVAIQTAREFAPDFKPALLERFERIRVRERFRNTTVNDEAAKAKLLSDNQVTSNQTNSIVSPNKQTNLNQQHNSQQQQQQQIQAQSSSSLLNPTAPARRTSVNPSAMRQPSVDYTMQNNTSIYGNKTNTVDYNNTLGHNQQFGQPQPAGNSMGGSGSAFSTPQKLAQNNANSVQQQYNQATSNISVQQSQQHNQVYQTSASHYQQSMNQSQENSFNNYQQQHNYNDHQGASAYTDPHTGLRRGSRQVSDSGRPMLGAIHQTSIDHFDHYKRPPSRDSSVDRYTRAASRLGASRPPSVDRQVIGSSPSANLTPEISIDRNVRAGSQLRGTTPAPPMNINGSVLTGAMGGGTGSTSASRRGSRSGTPVFQQQTSIQQIQAHYSTPNQPFEDVLLRQRTLGQDIIPSPGQPKRTESLFVPQKPIVSGGSGGGKASGGGGGSKAANKSIPINVTIQRKKSLPDVQQIPVNKMMSREEVSVLGSARREEVRRQKDESDRYRANPLLYLVSPQVKDWFSRQQLILLVLIVNIALAIMFFKMLT
ncbi:hypothetical protein ACKWTF_007214 [Chironomus riparius]